MDHLDLTLNCIWTRPETSVCTLSFCPTEILEEVEPMIAQARRDEEMYKLGEHFAQSLCNLARNLKCLYITRYFTQSQGQSC